MGTRETRVSVRRTFLSLIICVRARTLPPVYGCVFCAVAKISQVASLSVSYVTVLHFIIHGDAMSLAMGRRRAPLAWPLDAPAGRQRHATDRHRQPQRHSHCDTNTERLTLRLDAAASHWFVVAAEHAAVHRLDDIFVSRCEHGVDLIWRVRRFPSSAL